MSDGLRAPLSGPPADGAPSPLLAWTRGADEEPWSAEIGGVRVDGGSGVLERLGELTAGLGGRKVMLVTDPGLERAGHAERARALLAGAEIEVATFHEVSENPSAADVERGAAAARSAEPDLLVALGGGSVLDVAKGINFVFTNGGAIEDYWGYGKATRPMLPSIGVPTTGGTGSEAQSYAVIAQPESGRKMACGDPGARFRTVLLDPLLTATVPAAVAAAAGIDALSHAVESAVTRRRNPISAMLAREAFALLAASFEASLATPADLEARGRMLLGAHLAGAAIEASMLGAAHAAANPLTACFQVAHGVAVGLVLPAVVRFNRPAAAELYAELVPGGAVALAERLEALRAAGGLPGRLRDVGVERGALPELARRAMDEWTGKFNPRPLAENDFLRLYETTY